jgi:hypothetical protein
MLAVAMLTPAAWATSLSVIVVELGFLGTAGC